MEDSMRKRLEAATARVKEIDNELSSDEIATDVAKLTALSKERSSLEEQVAKFAEYTKCEQTVADAIEMIGSGDPELEELAREERKGAEETMAALEGELKHLSSRRKRKKHRFRK